MTIQGGRFASRARRRRIVWKVGQENAYDNLARTLNEMRFLNINPLLKERPWSSDQRLYLRSNWERTAVKRAFQIYCEKYTNSCCLSLLFFQDYIREKMDAFRPSNVEANQNASKGSVSANRATCSTNDSAVSYGSAGKSTKRSNPSLLLIDAKLTYIIA